jgi:hypothetical protein
MITAVAGCGPQSGSAGKPAEGSTATATTTAATTAAASPQGEFAADAAKLGDQPVKLKVTAAGGVAVTGAIDAQAHRAEMTSDLASSGSMDVREIGDDLYVKASGSLASVMGGSSGKWMHADTSKVPSSSALSMASNDPKGTAKMLAAGTDVTKTGPHSFSGKVDMTKSPAISSSAAATGIGAKLKAVPFTAETDGQGRITTIVFDLASISPSAGKMTTEYSDFGTPVDVQKPPASQTVEMPPSFLKMMGA